MKTIALFRLNGKILGDINRVYGFVYFSRCMSRFDRNFSLLCTFITPSKSTMRSATKTRWNIQSKLADRPRGLSLALHIQLGWTHTLFRVDAFMRKNSLGVDFEPLGKWRSGRKVLVRKSKINHRSMLAQRGFWLNRHSMVCSKLMRF